MAFRRHRVKPHVERLETRAMLAGMIAVGTDSGSPTEVRVFLDNDNNGTYETRAPAGVLEPVGFAPYPGFTGGARVDFGDFDGDGNDEMVTAAGTGGGPHVIIWDMNSDGTVGGVVDSFFAYAPSFTGGLFVAAGELNNDGKDELAVSMNSGGAQVKIFSDTDGDGAVSDNLTDTLDPFGAFGGGARIAFGNTNNTGGDELIVAAGPGGGPHVRVFTDSDNDRAVSDHAEVESFFAYGQFSGGVYVAAGAMENAGGGGAEIITGSGAGGIGTVNIYTDTNANGQVSDNATFEQFFPYSSFTGGVRVAAGDSDNSGAFVEVLTGAGPGGGPHVKIYDDNADAGSFISDNALDHDFFAFAGSYTGGVFMAFGKVLTGAAVSTNATFLPDSTTTISSIFVPAGFGIIRDLNLSINISHTHDPDLDVSLTHVRTGTTLVLFTDSPNGVSADGFIIRLDDEAATDIDAATATAGIAVSGTFNPEGTAVLSVFDNADASGEWRLTITDDAGGDTGSLFSWSLLFIF